MNKPTLIPFILRNKANAYCRAMAHIAGCDPAEESRRREVVTARAFIAYRLLMEGFAEHSIGAVLGWDHSTINHYRKKAAAMLSAPGYDDERTLWMKFNQEIEI